MCLENASSGLATIDGSLYKDISRPLYKVGCLISPDAYHKRRNAYQHLMVSAETHGIGKDRVLHLLDSVGLGNAAKKPVGMYSLGMKQRLGIANALLGDPGVIILDEPLNGLDPEGIYWFRNLVNTWSKEGRTVLISSHILSELEKIIDKVVILHQGSVVVDSQLDQLFGDGEENTFNLEELYFHKTTIK